MFNLVKAEEVGPCIFMYENIIDNCEELIALAKNSDESKKYDSVPTVIDGEEFNDSTKRLTSRIDINPVYMNNIQWFAIAQKLWHYGNQYGIDQNISFSEMEYPQFLIYEPNKGFYKKHFDSNKYLPRIFSAVLYLNDVAEGGETYFNNFDIAIKPKSGRLILFPANYAYVHEARIPISNEKNAIVTWFTP